MFEEGKLYQVEFDMDLAGGPMGLAEFIMFCGVKCKEEKLWSHGTRYSPLNYPYIYFSNPLTIPRFELLTYRCTTFPLGDIIHFNILSVLARFYIDTHGGIVLAKENFGVNILSEIDNHALPLWVPWLTEAGRDYLKTI